MRWEYAAANGARLLRWADTGFAADSAEAVPASWLTFIHDRAAFWASRINAPELQGAALIELLKACRTAQVWSPEVVAEFLADEHNLASRLADAGRFLEAWTLLREVSLPSCRPEQLGSMPVFLKAADVQRRLYRWHESAQWLNRAEGCLNATARPPESEIELNIDLLSARASLELERGRPDLAVPFVESARQIADAADNLRIDARALFLELRLAHGQDLPEHAAAQWQAFVRSPSHGKLAADHGEVIGAQLAIRAAHSVLGSPDQVDASRVSQAIGWLQDALLVANLSDDEQALARITLCAHYLRIGELDLAGRVAGDSFEPGVGELTERRLNWLALALQWSLDSDRPTPEISRRLIALQETFDRMLARWHEQPLSREGLGPLYFPDKRRVLSELTRAQCRLHGDAGAILALQNLIDAQSAGSLARALGATGTTVEQALDSLVGTKRVVIAYLAGELRSHVWILRNRAVRHIELAAGGRSIDAARRRWIGAVVRMQNEGSVPSKRYRQGAKQLAQMLLPGAVLASFDGARSVCIVGLETLGYTPFELLETSSGEPLGARFPLSYLPSIPVGVWLATHRKAPEPSGGKPRVRIIACVDAVEPKLRFGADERADFARSTQGAILDLVAGDGAAKRVLEVDDLPTSDMLQLIAHGVRDESRSDPQGIALSDTVIFGDTLERLALPRVLFLAVCGAGRGAQRRGDDGRQLLAGSAILGGARTVLAPWFEIDYRATLRASDHIHRALWRRGCTVQESLDVARRAAFNDRDEDSGAFELDPFLIHLVGLGDQALARAVVIDEASDASPSRTWLWLIAAFFALMSLAWLARIKK